MYIIYYHNYYYYLIVVLSFKCFDFCVKPNKIIYNAAFPAVYGHIPQALPPPIAAVAPAPREGKKKNTNSNFV